MRVKLVNRKCLVNYDGNILNTINLLIDDIFVVDTATMDIHKNFIYRINGCNYLTKCFERIEELERCW